MHTATSPHPFTGRTRRRLPLLIATGLAAALFASGTAEAHRGNPAATAPHKPPRAVLRMAHPAAKRAHSGRALARTSSTFTFTLPNPPAQCYIPGYGRAFKSLSVSG